MKLLFYGSEFLVENTDVIRSLSQSRVTSQTDPLPKER